MDCHKNAKDQITAYLKDAVRAVQAENIETDEAIGRCDHIHPSSKWYENGYIFSGRLLKDTFWHVIDNVIEERICRWLFLLEEYIAALPSIFFDVTNFVYTSVCGSMKMEFTPNISFIFERVAALTHFITSFPYLSYIIM